MPGNGAHRKSPASFLKIAGLEFFYGSAIRQRSASPSSSSRLKLSA